MFFFTQISHLSSNRREQNSTHLFQFKTPAKKLTHNTKFKHFHMQKDANFGNTIILHDFRPENPQNPIQKDRNFMKMHSLTSAKMPKNKESIFPEFHIFHTLIQVYSITPSNTNQLIIFFWEHLVTQLSNLADQL